MFLELSKKIDNSLLLNNFEAFKEDYLRFKEKGYFFDYTHNRDEVLHSPKRTDFYWQVCPLIYNRGDFPIASNDIKNSRSVEILKKLHPLPLVATFSIMKGNSEIPPHSDHDDEIAENNQHIPHALRTTSVVKYLYALDVPSDGECAITVNDQTKILKNKDILVFDETDTHSAYNRSNNSRGVLIISFLRHEIF